MRADSKSLLLRFLLLALYILSAVAEVSAQEFRSTRNLQSSPTSAEPLVVFPNLMGRRHVGVVLIGDSLSFGPFGERLELLLKNSVGVANVCIFASCGSSPENWIAGEPVYNTKCGYRQSTPKTRECFISDFNHGKAPPPYPTPKLGKILSKYQPDLIIIQQGTNWMDNFHPNRREDINRIYRIINGIIKEIRSGSPGSRIVWILPPASSKYPQAVQLQIAESIRRCAAAYRFRCIDSRSLTGPYIKGVTGRDGVHYSHDPAQNWANKTYQKLRGMEPEILAAP